MDTRYAARHTLLISFYISAVVIHSSAAALLVCHLHAPVLQGRRVCNTLDLKISHSLGEQPDVRR